MSRTTSGWGVNDVDYNVTLTETTGGHNRIIWMCPAYMVWRNMVKRVHNQKSLIARPRYSDTSIWEGWRNFSSFREWVLNVQPNTNWQNCVLDKDLLSKEIKIYSPDTCVFVTPMTNNFILDGGSKGLGAIWRKDINKYQARLRNPFTNKIECLGTFTEKSDSIKVWVKRKSELADTLASLQSDDRVASALRSYFTEDKYLKIDL